MPRRLRYSERTRIAVEGSLGDLEHDAVPEPLRNAVWHVFSERGGVGVGKAWIWELKTQAVRHFGWSNSGVLEYQVREGATVEEFLDLLEIAVETGQKKFRWSPAARTTSTRSSMLFGFPELEDELNDLFDRHRFGYRLEGGEARRVGSPALSEFVVGPALLAVQKPGWEEVERAYREAVAHQRGGPDERDDALTAANAALEAALKAIGLSGDRLGPLAKSLRSSDLVPGELKNVPEALDVLLKRQEAIRSNHGDAHGRLQMPPPSLRHWRIWLFIGPAPSSSTLPR